jgi:hypothetical protein
MDIRQHGAAETQESTMTVWNYRIESWFRAQSTGHWEKAYTYATAATEAESRELGAELAAKRSTCPAAERVDVRARKGGALVARWQKCVADRVPEMHEVVVAS